MKPLIYLELRQFLNAVRAMLRSPKRLIPVGIMGLWFLFVVVQDVLAATGLIRPVVSPTFVLHEAPPVGPLWAIVFVFLTVASAGVIYSALSEGMLVFAPAHIDFLFPTPVNRRHVLAFKLIKDYLRFALFAGLFFGVVGSPLYHVLNVPVYPDIFLSWIGSVLLMVFVMNMTHTLNIVATSGVHRLQFARVAVRLGLIALGGAVLVYAAVNYRLTNDIFSSVGTAIHSNFSRFLLAPIAWATDIILVPFRGIVDEYAELAWLFILAGGSTIVLLGRHEDVYEPSLAISTRIANVRRAMRSGNVTAARIQAVGWKKRSSYAAPPVPPFGTRAAALLWKSLVVRVRTSGGNLVAMMLLPVAIAAAIGSVSEIEPVRGVIPLILPYIAWVMALMGQQELRMELRQANILKAMPVSAVRAMAVQMLYEWLPILLVVLISAAALRRFVGEIDLALLVVSTSMALGFGMSCVAVVTIPAMLYPEARDKMQDIIAHTFSFLLAGLVLLPSVAVIAIGELTYASYWVTSATLIAVNATIATALIFVIGAMYSRFDPTSD